MYITYGQLLLELFVSGDSSVTSLDTTLSGKTVDPGGDIYTFTGTAPAPGDVVTQAGYTAIVIDVPTGTTIQIDLTGAANNIANGAAKFLHSDTITRARGEAEIKCASDFIDLQTRQWFEPRAKTVRLEGKNSNVLFFPVPIITVTEIRVNNETVGTNLDFFEIFNNQGGIPDDRRNPRIKMIDKGRNIFAQTNGRTFHRAAFSEVDGTFGFVESDSSTPVLIQKATTRLTVLSLKNPIGASASTSGLGAKKREKVDLHETEYFQPDDVKGGASGAISGDIEVDRILKMYRGPIGIGGAIMDLPRVESMERFDRDNLVI